MMNIGISKDGGTPFVAPPSKKAAVEQKPAANVNGGQGVKNEAKTDAVNHKPNEAVETHLTEHPLKKYSMKLLQHSFERHISQMELLQTNSQQSQQAKSDIDILRGLDVGKAMNAAKEKSLFDFEQVANNVLDFVGGALTSAAQSGADNEKLNNMLGQARKGVSKGIAEARKILGSDIVKGDDVDLGINKANDLITGGFNLFEKQINDPDRTTHIFTHKSYQEQMSEQVQNNAAIEISTKDGDKVSINFESIQAYQERLLSSESMLQSQDDGTSYYIEQLTEHQRASFNSHEFAFSVEGELDKEEIKAIGDIVKNVSKLADEFFNGDIEAAYKKAGELGFNEQQIAGFALDLSSTKTVQVSAAYKEIQAYQSEQVNMPESVKQPLKDYAQKLLQLVEQTQERLGSKEDLQNTVKEVIGHNFQLRGNQLLEAFNRFNHFNGSLVASELFTPAGLDNREQAKLVDTMLQMMR
jgi:hypothetical protein